MPDASAEQVPAEAGHLPDGASMLALLNELAPIDELTLSRELDAHAHARALAPGTRRAHLGNGHDRVAGRVECGLAEVGAPCEREIRWTCVSSYADLR